MSLATIRLLFQSRSGTWKCEEQCTRQTTHGNVKAWFNNWRMDLENLGFRLTLKDGSFQIPQDQLCRIVNLNEPALSLEGNDSRCGGRPRVTLKDLRIPCCSKRPSKSSNMMTFIGGSSALGQTLPPLPARFKSKG